MFMDLSINGVSAHLYAKLRLSSNLALPEYCIGGTMKDVVLAPAIAVMYQEIFLALLGTREQY